MIILVGLVVAALLVVGGVVWDKKGHSDFGGAVLGISGIFIGVLSLIALGMVLSLPIRVQLDLARYEAMQATIADARDHGETLRGAKEALDSKLFADMPIDKRVDAFVSAHELGKTYTGHHFFEWHYRLTLSCDIGRKAFVRDRNLNLDDEITAMEFFRAYGKCICGRHYSRS